jgi:conjugative transposon TraM protein
MNSENRNNIRITEGRSPVDTKKQQLRPIERLEKFKRPLIYFLMAIVCVACIYLIFKPEDENLMAENMGFNTAVPQAADDKLQSDKQKAYEQQLLEQKDEEKRNALTSLSDYWTDSHLNNSINDQSPVPLSTNKVIQADQNALVSYTNTQKTLGNFYSRDNTEIDHLRREISRLKSEAVQNTAEPKNTTVEEQLQLMEKSYQMAAKYLPSPKLQEQTYTKATTENKESDEKTNLVAVKSIQHSVISSLHRELSDSVFLATLNHKRFNGLQTDMKNAVQKNKNSIRAIVHETKTLIAETAVSLRLTESMQLGKSILPSGTIVRALAKFESGRLFLKISSIEYQGSINPVDIDIYDNDGQIGLYIPYSPEQNAVKDIAANMSQNSGTNIMMTQSAGQQAAADLSRGLIQGISGYFQKKIRTPKVTVKAGHQMFLVSNK